VNPGRMRPVVGCVRGMLGEMVAETAMSEAMLVGGDEFLRVSDGASP